MADKRQDQDVAKRPANQGEGDKASARRFNEAEQSFVDSPEGREAIAHVGEEDASTQREDQAAEREARERAKGEDPAVTRHRGHPDKQD